jgi:hypothetical protein
VCNFSIIAGIVLVLNVDLQNLVKIKGVDVDDVVHFYSANIHTIECSWRLADVLVCSQKVSHPEMRLVSAAIGVLTF